jgi:hypothetical protein
MKRSSRPRTTVELSKSFQQQLNTYALAASAAGVGVLSLAQAANAKIIYTPAHHVIRKNGHLNIDLNHDGAPDFTVFNSQFLSKSVGVNLIQATPDEDNAAVITTDTKMYFWSFAALKRGARVGYGCCFVQAKGILIAQCASARGTNSAPPCSAKMYNTIGDWINVKNRYLGVMFPIHGRTHYGWARLSVQVSRKPFEATAILTGYAYETTPNKPIIAGKTKGPDAITVQPASLGHLAAGASAIPAWRAEK